MCFLKKLFKKDEPEPEPEPTPVPTKPKGVWQEIGGRIDNSHSSGSGIRLRCELKSASGVGHSHHECILRRQSFDSSILSQPFISDIIYQTDL